ncbi:MarR family winged helix-turn-helix transcriptional regulator [Streptomyces sp. NBC_00287]|uniref:MarR family winged helix-turn-helix transcriptional regulator n=1 Tax=Streptomyces sp. NBC_00287 TaxID=2975702 RepID=UPI002E289539|nr:MarR family winged helix-turn-helix transcriptional regulator [Streptomyces sp. NBC_00287]
MTGQTNRSRSRAAPGAGDLQAASARAVGPRAVNDLEAEQLIERRRSPQDRRRHVVEITANGLELLDKAECALAAAENEVLAALDATERETLYSLLQQAANGEGSGSCTEAWVARKASPGNG